MNKFWKKLLTHGQWQVATLAIILFTTTFGRFNAAAQEGCTDNPTTNIWCADGAQLILSNIVISPTASNSPPFNSIVCVGDTITASLALSIISSTNGKTICHTCNGSIPTNYCDPTFYTTGVAPTHITNSWNYSTSNGSTNGLGNSVTFELTNSMGGAVTFYNVSAQISTNPPQPCGLNVYWPNNSRTYAFVKVKDLSAGGYAPISDDGTNKTYLACPQPGGVITVLAASDPGVGAQWLPNDWLLSGGRVQDKATSLVDITNLGTSIVTCTAGWSQKKVTIVVANLLGLGATNVFVNNDDDNNDGTNDVNDPTSGAGSCVTGEQDLIPLVLNIPSCVAPTQMVTLAVSAGGGKIRIWPNSTRGPGSPFLDSSNGQLSTNWLASQVPTNVWIEGVSPSSALGDVSLSLTIGSGGSGNSETTNLTVFYMQAGADVYHTHSITFDSMSTNYFWVDDVGVSGDIIPDGTDVPGSGNNGSSGGVNGRCDVGNFFPVGLKFGNTLQLLSPTNGYQYRLIGNGVSFVYTSLPIGNAFNYLTDVTGTNGYGSSFSTGAYAADTVAVNGYAVLSTSFLTNALNNGGVGLILMEGSAATTQPLKLQVWKNGQELGSDGQLNLSIAGVEQMYRYINLRGGYSGPPAAPSNYPANICNQKMFVFVHGYNVNANSSRGWSAEMFKRLYQSGSRAMFTGVDWQGDDGQLPIAGGVTPDYYKNVVHAFDTASNLTVAVNDLPGNGKYIAGHSLGNMVVSSAIQDCGLQPAAYFMIDAAVAIEAYSPDTFGSGNLVNPHYWPNYDSRLYASRWNELFASDSSDGRNGLTWRGRFENVSGINYYSSTEDVLANADGKLHWPFKSKFAWVTQEMRKGTVWPGQLFGGEAGWGFNIYYSTYSISDADGISDAQLKANSFFGSFSDSTLYDSSGGSAEAAKSAVREQVLADGIPAWSNAAGGPDGSGLGGYDMSAHETGWPTIRVNDPKLTTHWLHSDIKNIAYPFNHEVFESIGGYLQ